MEAFFHIHHWLVAKSLCCKILVLQNPCVAKSLCCKILVLQNPCVAKSLFFGKEFLHNYSYSKILGAR